MLGLLLDEQISPVVAKESVRTCAGIQVVSVHTWEDGAYLGTADPEILIGAARQKLTLVTFDQKTMWGHLVTHTDAGEDHGGVIFVDERTIAPHDFGKLIRALCALWQTRCQEVWTNRTLFLTRPISVTQAS